MSTYYELDSDYRPTFDTPMCPKHGSIPCKSGAIGLVSELLGLRRSNDWGTSGSGCWRHPSCCPEFSELLRVWAYDVALRVLFSGTHIPCNDRVSISMLEAIVGQRAS